MMTSARIELIPRNQKKLDRREVARAQALLRASYPDVAWSASQADMRGDVATVMAVAREIQNVLREGRVQTLTTLVKFDSSAAVQRRVLRKIS